MWISHGKFLHHYWKNKPSCGQLSKCRGKYDINLGVYNRHNDCFFNLVIHALLLFRNDIGKHIYGVKKRKVDHMQ